jgi:hypothetical protein
MCAADCSCLVKTSSIEDSRSDSTTLEVFFSATTEDTIYALILERGYEEAGAHTH